MIENYNRAKKLGEREYRLALRSGQYPYPPALDDLVESADSLPQMNCGIHHIPLYMISGTRTAGRQGAFARNFMPILEDSTEFATKWSNLYDIQIKEGYRDPVKLYEYMNRFYIQEGNKRVSVLKYLDVPLVTADVIRLVPPRTNDKENRIYYEFLEFYKVAPVYDVTFSEEGGYAKLAEAMGLDLVHPWPEDAINTLRSALAIFGRHYKAKGGAKLPLTLGDAFLIYLSVYTADSLLTDSGQVIDARLSKLWNEFLTETGEDKISLVENREAIEAEGGILDTLMRSRVYGKTHPLVVAFLYDKSPEESAWIYGHELGRNDIENDYTGVVKTLRYDHCSDEETLREAVNKAVNAGAELIFTTSPAQMAETLKFAIHFRNVKFLNCSVNLSHNAVRCYYGRMYEAKFVMGAVAASVSSNHRIGYLATYPLYGTIASINAFAIGAALVDPQVKLYLSWTSVKGSDWKREMTGKGVDIISGPDLIMPTKANREYGIYRLKPLDRSSAEEESIAGAVLSNADGNPFVIENIAMPVLNWGRYYELIVRSVLDGSYSSRSIARSDKALNYWLGMSAGVIDVFLSEKTSYYTRRLAEVMKNGILSDMLHPFDGELHSQSGLVKGPDAPGLTSEEIINMRWLNDNVVGRIPDISELTEEAQRTVRISGVTEQAD